MLEKLFPDRDPPPELDWRKIHHKHSETVYRAVDEEAGVVLYRWRGNDKGGLTAIPIDQTDL